MHAHFSAQRVHSHTRTLLMRCHIHAWLKGVKKVLCTCVVSLYLAFSSLMSRPSLLVPARSLRAHLSVRTVLAVLRCPESAGACATPHEDEKFGYLANSALITGYEPNEFGKITPVDNDTHDTLWRSRPQLKSLTSRNTHEKIGHFDVFTMFESSVSHVSHDDLALQIGSKEIMQSGNRCQRERERGKRRFCDQCCRVDVKGRSTELYQCESAESQKNPILTNEVFENIFNEELDKLFLVKIHFREII